MWWAHVDLWCAKRWEIYIFYLWTVVFEQGYVLIHPYTCVHATNTFNSHQSTSPCWCSTKENLRSTNSMYCPIQFIMTPRLYPTTRCPHQPHQHGYKNKQPPRSTLNSEPTNMSKPVQAPSIIKPIQGVLNHIKHPPPTLPLDDYKDHFPTRDSSTCPTTLLHALALDLHMSSQLWSRWSVPHSHRCQRLVPFVSPYQFLHIKLHITVI